MEKKKAGNPNLQKKSATVNTSTGLDVNKNYEFELIKTYEKYKPTDENGNPIGLPYPPYYGLANEGIAFDEATGKKRRWRYLSGYDSIWVDEQEPEPTPLEMAREENQLEFINGKMLVRGMDQTKIAALMIQDGFLGKKVKVKNIPPIYRLNNPDEAIENSLKTLDQAYEAEKLAREASEEDMMVFAHVLGINLDQSEEGIKRDFIVQAKANPAYFLKHFVNPKNKFNYVFSNALKENEISANVITNKLVWVGTGVVICDVNTNGDIASQLATMAMEGDEAVTKLFDQLEKL